MNPGILYLVPTPIGNLEDMTARALHVLESVDVIAAEDTRHSKTLLNHYGISTGLLALHEHNEKQRAESLISRMQQGDSIALISDAGTPLISDPGFPLVRACREAGIRIVALPGACAAITALSASGLPTDTFRFCGFLPAKQGARVKHLQSLADATETLVFYEAPRRILECLEDIATVFGGHREVVIGRELTKQFETYLAGEATQVHQLIAQDSNQQRGEMVLLIHGAQKHQDETPKEALALLSLLSAELPPKKAAKLVAEHYGLSANQLYQHKLTQQD
ncbi:MAG: 16S rRNA (cytidine(1402)-2'-O)-methyltransferase RsmI [Idiomarinaceae bacterium HL-53]|nr:MAG: 16S rRNA (cytidine(1402)-2'-O)-methyltransferase RsmI [Idiomarinaceae bacterium HL-53]CUS47404.1 16S rRNA (cytidine1402-2'-O)-methyltransferase [Idiomarinaceae bacterium HL-53]